MNDPTFWDDNTEAQKTIAKCNALKAWTLPYRSVCQKIENVKALLPEVLELADLEMLEAQSLCLCFVIIYHAYHLFL